MKSVGNIAKITKAMKMVAASRLRGVQIRMEQSRGLPLPMVKLLGDFPGAFCSLPRVGSFVLAGSARSLRAAPPRLAGHRGADRVRRAARVRAALAPRPCAPAARF